MQSFSVYPSLQMHSNKSEHYITTLCSSRLSIKTTRQPGDALDAFSMIRVAVFRLSLIIPFRSREPQTSTAFGIQTSITKFLTTFVSINVTCDH